MGKPSRRQRKQLREKRIRAEGLGLPSTRASTMDNCGGSTVAESVGKQGAAGDEQAGSPSQVPKEARGWSSWPMSIRLLLVGILALVAIGLYRRYTEDRASRENNGHGDALLGSPEQSDRAKPPAVASVEAAPGVPTSSAAP